jgi:hypothetical protein
LVPGLPEIPGVTTQAGAPAPAAQAPGTNPFAGTPLEGLFPQGLPQLPGLPGEPAPAPAAQPGAQPQNPPAQPGAPAPAAGNGTAPGAGVVPAAAPIAYEGDAAVETLLGRKPSSMEYLMLSSILEGGTLRVTEEAAS